MHPLARFCLPALSCLAVVPALAGPVAVATPAGQDLSTTIAAALAHAPALAEARASEAEADAHLDAARAEGHPQLGVDGSWGAGRLDNDGFFGSALGYGARNVQPLSLRAGAEMPLYAGGRTAAAIAGAQGGVALARAGAEQSRLAVMVEAVSTYAGVTSARRMHARTGQMLRELAEVAHQAELRFRAGEIPSSDLAAARARLAEGEAALALAEGRLASAEAHYRRLTGMAAGALAPLPAPPATPASLEVALARAGADNPALKQAGDAVSVARAGVRGAEAERLPTIGAFAEATRMRDAFFPGYRGDAYTVGVRGHWTLWAGGRTGAKIAAADAALDASQARERAAREAVEGGVIDAWSALHAAQTGVQAGRSRVAAAEEALRATRLEAQVGQKPTLAVLDAEREAMAAEAAEIEAEGQALVAAWQLNALAGTTP